VESEGNECGVTSHTDVTNRAREATERARQTIIDAKKTAKELEIR
jgi:hypothetical protein